jgi:hypothetical protein
VLAGILVTPLGLRTTFEVFGGPSPLSPSSSSFEAWRTRPQGA